MIQPPGHTLAPMSLGELVAGVHLGAAASSPEIEVTDLVSEPSSVTPGALFICEPEVGEVGARAAEAIARGAAALLVETPLGLDLPELRVRNVRGAMGPLARQFFRDPTSELALAGVTGTNGKTTTTTWLRWVLEAAGRRCGLLGTIQQVIGDRAEPAPARARDPVELQRTFRAMLERGDVACSMEVTSHALRLHRVDRLTFGVRVFTNLSHDHLDFHGTLADYFEAKRRLFTEFTGAAVVNIDNPHGRRLTQDTDCITFSRTDSQAVFLATNELAMPTGTSFHCHTPNGVVQVMTPSPCGFNVENALAVLASAYALGVDPSTAAGALASAEPPPGRLEAIEVGQPFAAYVDYAHTPDALERVLQGLRERTAGRLITVFGCGGARDRRKRPAMGRIASRESDLVVLTADNSRNEATAAIVAEILAGVPDPRRPRVDVDHDRRAAIRLAIAEARAGDTVLVAGKGHEPGQQIGGGVIPFDDRTAVRDELLARVRSAAPRPPRRI
jgi:UDP-N-acetylmuramoyl-L-alanyl-D-glutamate--2,6-diaminopimelate ligase